MKFEGEGKLLRIFIGESDRFEGKPLYQALVQTARAEGLAGATVLRGMEGFGASSHLHTSRILRLSEDLPIIVEIVDTVDNIDRLIPVFDQMVGDGMMTLEKAEVVTYRARGERSTVVVDDRLRMLAEQAQTFGPLEAVGPEGIAALRSSVLAAHQYGATEGQIAEASGMTVEQAREILTTSLSPERTKDTRAPGSDGT